MNISKLNQKCFFHIRKSEYFRRIKFVNKAFYLQKMNVLDQFFVNLGQYYGIEKIGFTIFFIFL